MKTDGVLIHTLSRALEWMPNVSCITYSPFPRHLPAEHKETSDLIPRAITASPNGANTSSDHPFRQLIAALCMSQFTGIRELKTEHIGVDSGTEFSLGIFDLDDNEMTAASFLFEHLEKLVLAMSFWVPDLSLFDEISAKFSMLLCASTDLRYLSLHPTHWNSQTSTQPLFTSLGLQATWPSLQYLRLQDVLADESDFSGLIKRHKKTLSSVVLRECTLLQGLWVDVVDEVVYGTCVHQFLLDRVHESNLSDLDYATLDSSEKESWRYEGMLEIANNGDRNFVSGIIAS